MPIGAEESYKQVFISLYGLEWIEIVVPSAVYILFIDIGLFFHLFKADLIHC